MSTTRKVPITRKTLKLILGGTSAPTNGNTLAQRLSDLVNSSGELPTKMGMDPLVTLKGANQVKLSPAELHKTATRLSLLLEKNHVAHGDLVLLYYDCPIKILSALYGCWYRGAVPIPVQSGPDGRDRVNCIVSSIQVQFVLAPNKKQLPGLSKTIKIVEAGIFIFKLKTKTFPVLKSYPKVLGFNFVKGMSISKKTLDYFGSCFYFVRPN